jgi:hypothetical protein
MFFVLRCLGAIVAAAVLALVLVIAVEMFSNVVHPLPPDCTMEEMCAHVARYPHWVLGVVVLLWGGTAFISTWVAARLGNRGCGVFIGLLLLAAVAQNVSMLPYPSWFEVVILIAIPAAAWLGLGVAKREKQIPRAEPKVV